MGVLKDIVNEGESLLGEVQAGDVHFMGNKIFVILAIKIFGFKVLIEAITILLRFSKFE